jgi:hypothetical protein
MAPLDAGFTTEGSGFSPGISGGLFSSKWGSTEGSLSEGSMTNGGTSSVSVIEVEDLLINRYEPMPIPRQERHKQNTIITIKITQNHLDFIFSSELTDKYDRNFTNYKTKPKKHLFFVERPRWFWQ